MKDDIHRGWTEVVGSGILFIFHLILICYFFVVQGLVNDQF